ncbi:MAG: DUF3108 domain-containing protein [Cyclobacteriaceae bacterium]|nr:DUF3108 domain-containing protein [Cyclobacteriaceae bacterium]
MKKWFAGFLVIAALSNFLSSNQKDVPVTRNISYSAGEELEYRVHLAFFTVGRGITRIDNKFHQINSRTCYKIDAFGKTSDWISWVAKFDDNWGAYIDTATQSTHVAYRKLKEGTYRRDELVYFDQEKNKAEVKVKNAETGVYEDPKVYDVPKNAKDLVGGFMFLRLIDFSRVNKGDTLTISGFLENASYNLRIIYMGKEVVNTKVGKIQCLRIRPIMPANSLFDGENSIACWISDDLNKIPIKVQAKMFIGSAGLELVSFRGLRN